MTPVVERITPPAIGLRDGRPSMGDWPWTAAWLHHYGDPVPSAFVLVEDDAGALHADARPAARAAMRTEPAPLFRLAERVA